MAKSKRKLLEVFAYLEKKSNIEGMNRDDLQNLLLVPGVNKQYKNLRLSVHNPSFLIIHDRNIGQNRLLKCVKKYYNVNETDCYRIRNSLGVYNEIQRSDISPCVDCHLACITKFKNNEFQEE